MQSSEECRSTTRSRIPLTPLHPSPSPRLSSPLHQSRFNNSLTHTLPHPSTPLRSSRPPRRNQSFNCLPRPPSLTHLPLPATVSIVLEVKQILLTQLLFVSTTSSRPSGCSARDEGQESRLRLRSPSAIPARPGLPATTCSLAQRHRSEIAPTLRTHDRHLSTSPLSRSRCV